MTRLELDITKLIIVRLTEDLPVADPVAVAVAVAERLEHDVAKLVAKTKRLLAAARVQAAINADRG